MEQDQAKKDLPDEEATKTDSCDKVDSYHNPYYFFVSNDLELARLHTYVLARMTRLTDFDKRIRGFS